MQYLAIDGLGPFVTSTITLLVMFYVTFSIDSQLAMVAMVISPVLFMLSMMYRPRFRKRSREVKQLESSAMAVLQEVLSVVRVVKAFGREKHEEGRYVHKSQAGMWARIQLDLLGGCYSLLVGLTTALGTACVLWIGVHHVRAGTLTLGSLLLVVSYLGQLYAPLKTIGRKATSLQTHWVGLERAFSVLDQLPDVPERPNARPEATEEEVVQAAKLADAHDFILALPNGYQTVVGERGIRLSGGERQRISLARAFLKDAPILLLDEPTSSVDMKTEAAILKATERLMRGRTTFTIAHRLSTLESCDVMLGLEHGRLVQMGVLK